MLTNTKLRAQIVAAKLEKAAFNKKQQIEAKHNVKTLKLQAELADLKK